MTSPAPETSRSGFDTQLSNTPFLRRPSIDDTPGAMDDYSPEVGSDDELPITPPMAAAALRKLPRKVGFVQPPQKTIFRYPAADLHETDEDWWWDGWEESEDDTSDSGDSTMHHAQALTLAPGGRRDDDSPEPGQERIGRPRLRRKEPFIA